jgi:hypothetical protein
MSSILTEVVTWLLGEAISARIPTTPTPEGVLNASLGAVAAFFGFVSVMVAIPAVLFSLHRGPFPAEGLLFVTTLLLVVGGCGALGMLAARRAPRVTSRNLALAKLGYGACRLAIAGSVVAAVVAAVRVLL